MIIKDHWFDNGNIILHVDEKRYNGCSDYYLKCFKWQDQWYLEYLQSISFNYDTTNDGFSMDYETIGNSLGKIVDKELINSLIGIERKRKLEKLLS